nr:MAG TPA: hypothetical protein [Caudoviricetes sp.]
MDGIKGLFFSVVLLKRFAPFRLRPKGSDLCGFTLIFVEPGLCFSHLCESFRSDEE